VVPACRAFGLGVLVWSPLAAGFLSGKYRRDQKAPSGSRLESWGDRFKRFDNDRGWGIIDALGRVAARREATHASVALAWLLARPEVSSVIVGARTVAQLQDNLAALSVKLSPEDIKELDAASRPDWGYPQAFIEGIQPW
jgi:aryl-alcohol dehydrogenase-like predicted oxidoreductase